MQHSASTVDRRCELTIYSRTQQRFAYCISNLPFQFALRSRV